MILKIIFISGFIFFACFTLWAIVRGGDVDEDE